MVDLAGSEAARWPLLHRPDVFGRSRFWHVYEQRNALREENTDLKSQLALARSSLSKLMYQLGAIPELARVLQPAKK